jgi:hypothetical protein
VSAEIPMRAAAAPTGKCSLFGEACLVCMRKT